MIDIKELRSRPLESILKDAWAIRRKNFKPVITVSAPSPKTYVTDRYENKRNRFVNISLTGKKCALNCEHCRRKLLETMIPATTPEKLRELGDNLVQKGCTGILLSGGATDSGNVPLDGFFDAMTYLKSKGLQVIVHTGLVTEDTAINLKDAGVDQVLIDVIGDQETISRVYHLNKTPDDFAKSLKFMKEADLNIAPHIVIGLNYGKIVGEYNAIEMISKIKPGVIVLVVLSPMYDTPMYGSNTPSPGEIAKIAAVTRIANPDTPLTLGCVRPAGFQKLETEKLMIRAGVNNIAYAMDETMEYSESLGLKIEFNDVCCSLLNI